MNKMKQNGKKISLKPMSVTEVRTMQNQQVKKPSLMILATEKEVNQVLDQGETVYMMVPKGNANAKQVSQQWGPITTLLKEYQDVFPADLPPRLPPFYDIEHQIELIPSAPLLNKVVYHCTFEQMKELQCQIEELIKMGYVRESLSPHDVSVLLVPKKDGGYRIYICSRVINNITVKDRFHIQRLDDMLDELHGVVIFSKIDLRIGYHQIKQKKMNGRQRLRLSMIYTNGL